MIAIAFASLLIAVYGGYISAPWWSTIICTITLFLTVATSHLRIQCERRLAMPAFFVGVDLLPYCFAASFGAYAFGCVAQFL
jgi:hypothetical protein